MTKRDTTLCYTSKIITMDPERYEPILTAYENKKNEVDDLNRRRIRASVTEDAIRRLIKTLRDMTFRCTAFDERLWGGIVDKMEVHRGGDVVFHFKGGVEVIVEG